VAGFALGGGPAWGAPCMRVYWCVNVRQRILSGMTAPECKRQSFYVCRPCARAGWQRLAPHPLAPRQKWTPQEVLPTRLQICCRQTNVGSSPQRACCMGPRGGCGWVDHARPLSCPGPRICWPRSSQACLQGGSSKPILGTLVAGPSVAPSASQQQDLTPAPCQNFQDASPPLLWPLAFFSISATLHPEHRQQQQPRRRRPAPAIPSSWALLQG
jgi:hypothetical protein